MSLAPSFTFGASPDVRLSFSPDNLPSIQQCLEPQQPPSSKQTLKESFSFAIPEAYRTPKPSLLRWLDDVPTPVQHRKSSAPANAYREKHDLDHDTSDEAPDDDDHRQKRAKLRKSWPGHPGLLAQQSKNPSKPKKGFFRRLSNVCQKVMTPSPRNSEDLNGTTFLATGSGSGLSSRPTSCLVPPNRPQMKFVFVGDSKCGKSSLLLRSYLDTFNESSLPTQYELYCKTMLVDGQYIDLEMWDTSGKIDLHQLEKLSYLSWDAVFLCFNLTSQKSFQHTHTKWLKEIRTYCKDVPIILVGLKKDERSNSGLWTPFYRGARISAGEGAMAATAMGAVKYLECSAKTGEGVTGVLEQGVRSVFVKRVVDEEKAQMKSRAEEKALAKRLSQSLCFA